MIFYELSAITSTTETTGGGYCSASTSSAPVGRLSPSI